MWTFPSEKAPANSPSLGSNSEAFKKSLLISLLFCCFQQDKNSYMYKLHGETAETKNIERSVLPLEWSLALPYLKIFYTL